MGDVLRGCRPSLVVEVEEVLERRLMLMGKGDLHESFAQNFSTR